MSLNSLVPIFKATSLRFEDQEQLTHTLAQPNGTQHAIYIDASRLSGADKKPIQELISTSSHVRGLAFWSIPDVVEQLAALAHLEVFSIRFTYDFGVGVDVCTDDGFIQPIFKSLTHLYCDYIAPWADDEYNADFPVAAFPVLTHAAFNFLNLETVENAHPELMFDGAEKFLKITSLQKLIFRIDRLP
ncbi:hypothetical protein DL96DRAFT_1006066 [Flagelloscypha sp. PMI_526]|nr:hypothetical protein DL96DRAFT_1006066 [Flagelloscypha sp. PMI_526]